ncbi:MAG: CDP-diacylglycerol--glycerol-3-phosphate 3-phosphatidyltransferase [Oscillospiraceae bacterium]|nr:CDP-diacylglycerol--glycerol-3-phosphate 3-phosphatidyltransferase [Oscillospiraceae bacterium]MBR2806501.1 CDP-diacylglycerol--glycerol-3-phosphate 3-phosphatidyltransferase [Oscillospiraceae bacterium]
MNLSNKLTIMRVILVPVMLFCIYCTKLPHNWMIAFVVFVAASFTDWLDGHLARKNGWITNFGKFLDPLADKILVVAALIVFIPFKLAHPVAVIIIISRDLMISGIRLIASTQNGKVIAANWWGKIKTGSQMVVISAIMFFADIFGVANPNLILYGNIGVWIVSAFTLISGIVYMYQNASVLKETN